MLSGALCYFRLSGLLGPVTRSEMFGLVVLAAIFLAPNVSYCFQNRFIKRSTHVANVKHSLWSSDQALMEPRMTLLTLTNWCEKSVDKFLHCQDFNE